MGDRDPQVSIDDATKANTMGHEKFVDSVGPCTIASKIPKVPVPSLGGLPPNEPGTSHPPAVRFPHRPVADRRPCSIPPAPDT